MVTGGGGFLGRYIVGLLRARGDDVCVLARRLYPAVEALGATSTQVDIRDIASLQAAIGRAQIVFHVAAQTGYWGPREEFWSTNVEGTRNVLEAVQALGVPRLVYTSTPSVVGYERDVENGGPDLPYATIHESVYPESKAVAEQLVLGANGGGVATMALRPHLIIGPGDHRMMPRVVRRAMQGQLRIIGDGQNRVDLTYVENAAWAHLDAADALTDPEASCAGKAYFISNGEPVVLWEWLNRLLHDLGLPKVSRSLSLPTARLAATATEMLWRTLRINSEPPITRFLAGALARSHWYDIEPAQRDLGYHVRVPMEEATRRTIQWLAETVLGDVAHAPQDDSLRTHGELGTARSRQES